ncbi:hypothetical protein BC829DRAFT_248601 [Chytridium lagenaria]|nr:hypothetical protein BC829DRAFT_248601 [Chytridium lagenaria]
MMSTHEVPMDATSSSCPTLQDITSLPHQQQPLAPIFLSKKVKRAMLSEVAPVVPPMDMKVVNQAAKEDPVANVVEERPSEFTGVEPPKPSNRQASKRKSMDSSVSSIVQDPDTTPMHLPTDIIADSSPMHFDITKPDTQEQPTTSESEPSSGRPSRSAKTAAKAGIKSFMDILTQSREPHKEFTGSPEKLESSRIVQFPPLKTINDSFSIIEDPSTVTVAAPSQGEKKLEPNIIHPFFQKRSAKSDPIPEPPILALESVKQEERVPHPASEVELEDNKRRKKSTKVAKKRAKD